MASLTSGQRTFAQHLARLTGLNSRAISAWMLAEESGGAAQSRQRQRNNNWLNIGYFDSGPGAITKDQAFRDPVRAAHYTADFLKGKRGGAAPGIRAILRTANQGPEQQLRAVAASPWASSHYGGAGRLVSLLHQAPAPGVASVGGTSTPRGSSGGGSAGFPGRAERIRTITETTPGVDNRVGRAALIQSFLEDNSSLDPLDFALQARQLQDVAPTSTSRTIRTPGIPARARTVAGDRTGAAGATPVERGANAGGGAAAALSWAESKIGAPGSRETGGANRGKLPDFLNQRFGFGTSGGQPWCAMFTSAAVTKGGAPPSARTASVAQVRQKAQAGTGYVRGLIPARQARPGDLVLFGNSHIAMVTANHNGRISYVGGNQSNAVTKGTTGAGGNVTVVRPKYGARKR